MLDFAALPPEINSARMYLGPGSGPLLAAATAWKLLASELECAATGYGRTIIDLAATWRGPASLSMGRSAAPVTAWLAATAIAAEQTAVQATAAAGSYELAFAMTVPPPLIAANRALLMALVATNLLGQNTPAIAAAEAHYAQMWIQDAVAMYTYAGSSAAANRLTAFTTPTPSSNSAGLTAQSAAATQATGSATGSQATTLPALMASTPAALQQLAAPTVTTTAPTVVDLLEHIPNVVNTTMSTNNAVASGRNIDITNHRLAFQQTRTPAPLLVAAPAVAAAMGRADAVGGLAVPANWATPPTAVRPVALALPTAGPVAAPAATTAAMPGSMFAQASLATLERRDGDQRQPKSTPVLVRPAAAR